MRSSSSVGFAFALCLGSLAFLALAGTARAQKRGPLPPLPPIAAPGSARSDPAELPPETVAPRLPPPPPPPSPVPTDRDKLLNEVALRSPLGQYVMGVRRFGVYDVHDASACSRWAIETLKAMKGESLKLLGNDDRVLDRASVLNSLSLRPQTFALGDMARGFRGDLARALAALRLAGDDFVEGRHVCVGFAAFAAPNADSTGAGFILYDPQIFFDLNHKKDRSMRSGEAVALHELAHQFQYWSKEQVLNDKTAAGEIYARRAELQADCIGSALVALSAPELGAPDLWKLSRPGVLTAFREAGDFAVFAANHHGLPVERELAAEYGLRLAEAWRVDRKRGGIGGRQLLDECRAYIVRMDARWGTPWPARATVLMPQAPAAARPSRLDSLRLEPMAPAAPAPASVPARSKSPRLDSLKVLPAR